MQYRPVCKRDFDRVSEDITKQLADGWVLHGSVVVSDDLKHRTEEEWAALPDGRYGFDFIGPDGKPAVVVLWLWGGRAKVRRAEFDLGKSYWNIKRESSDHFCESYREYWRQVRKQHTARSVRCSCVPCGKSGMSMGFLNDDSGIWLHRAAQFLSDPRNLEEVRAWD